MEIQERVKSYEEAMLNLSLIHISLTFALKAVNVIAGEDQI